MACALFSGAVLLVMGMVLPSQTHAGFVEPQEPKELNAPFAMLASIPDHVDAAVVLNNPAEQFLLNDTGRSVRKAMSVTGLFGQTMGAFDALAGAFNADAESTIKGLLSQRTVIIWDEIDQGADSLFNFANTMDTNWVVLSEIDSAYLAKLRAQLKPIKRRLAHGQVVYAIEKGRYELILLEAAPQRAPMMLLAPNKGSALLDQTLSRQLHTPQNQPKESFVDRHQSLIETLGHEHPQWLAAWLIHNNRVLGGMSKQSPPQNQTQSQTKTQLHPEHSSATVGVLTLDGPQAVISLASDIQIPHAMGDAPVGLLSAAGDDAILAVALGQTPSLVIERNLMSAFFEFGGNEQSQSDNATSATQAGLVLLTDNQDHPQQSESHGSTALTVLVEVDHKAEHQEQEQAQDTLPARVDDFVHGLFMPDDPTQSPDYQGRFPNAVRTHHFPSSGSEDSDPPGTDSGESSRSAWPGGHPKFSWISARHRSKDAMIASIGPSTADTAERVKWMKQAIESFDAIPDRTERTGVISSGYFYPSRASDLLSSGSGLDLAISKLFKRVQWDITRMQAGVRGTVRIEFTRFEHLSNLGTTPRDQ